MTDYQSLKETPTWAVAVVCFVLVALSILLEHILHLVGKWLKNRDKIALCEALEKIKAELMLMGFLSFLLTVTQDYVARICIPKSVGATWHPCEYEPTEKEGRKLLQFSDSFAGARRSLAETGTGPCAAKGMVPFVSSYSIHQLHIFIFVLAVFHIVYCITTLALGTIKMKIWKKWENETKTLEYRCHNDPERFRFARETTFGRRHLSAWSQSKVSLWIVCFFRQFFRSVTKVDYLTLRHGFIMAHLRPESETKFDFQKYISRSLEEDFKVVVGISPIMWLFGVFFLLTTTHGWYSYLWLPFIPLIIILTVGTKLQVIITRMGLSTQDKGHVVKGAPLVQPGDDLFWFKSPRLVLFLIHFILFQNAFQLAFLLWSVYEELDSCYHKRVETIAIKVSIGVIIQVLCSYVTLPLYALVTQMGSNMRPTIFNDKVVTALKQWHRTAKKHTKHSHHSDATPFTSLPATPTHGISPVHLLHNYNGVDSLTFQATPRTSNADADHWDGVELTSPSNLEAGGGGGNGGSGRDGNSVLSEDGRRENQEPSGIDQHEVGITFHFEK